MAEPNRSGSRRRPRKIESPSKTKFGNSSSGPKRWSARRRLLAVLGVGLTTLFGMELGARLLGFEHVPDFVTQPEAKLVAIRNAESLHNIDAIVIGASDIDAGIIPSVVNENAKGDVYAFNASLAGMLPENYLMWNSVIGDQGPAFDKVLVSLPVAMFVNTSEGLRELRRQHSEAVAAGIRDSVKGDSFLIRVLSKFSVAFDNRSRLSKFDVAITGGWYDPSRGRTVEREADSLATGIDPLGWNKRYIAPGDADELYVVGSELERRADEADSYDQFDGVARLVQGFESAGYSVVALIPPGNVSESLDSVGFEAARLQLVRTLADVGVPVIDAYRGYGVSDYHDRDHLNRAGAEKLSRFVGSEIALRCKREGWAWCDT